ncbi:hypothetical protein [Plantactinospora sp. WMMB782]|uniref:hypothetical protein n=1 Tax=Plantactinospora sp. WMMB782 TaxID=3404121 RepID=UPI003B9446C6
MYAYKHQYYLSEEGQDPYPPYLGDPNGLVYLAEGGGIQILTGANTGMINLTVDLLDAAPPMAAAGWDEIVEVSYTSQQGRALVLGWPAKPVNGLPPVSAGGPGHYRIRFHARHRDDARNLDPLTVVEEHYIAAWPARRGPVELHKLSDEFGQRYRESGL